MPDLATLEVIIIAQLATCLVMTGVIWVIQLVHYPSFARIEDKAFVDFIHFHGQRISWIVVPLMSLELASSIALAVLRVESQVWIWNLIGVVLIWASTFFLSVPCHKRLEAGFDEKVIDRLIVTNWPRTILWSLRSVMLVSTVWSLSG